jgi:hypothetical protein
MRTTVVLDDDVVAETERLRREKNLGLSQALNYLARRGMAVHVTEEPYRHESAPLGLRLDVTNVADVLEFLDDQDPR